MDKATYWQNKTAKYDKMIGLIRTEKDCLGRPLPIYRKFKILREDKNANASYMPKS